MLRLDNHGHALWLEIIPDALGDLGGEALLDLQTMRVALQHPRQLGDAHHPAVGQITDVGLSDHRQHVVLAETDEADVAQDDQLIIAADLLEGALEIAAGVGLIAGEQLDVGARHAGGGVEQTFAGHIVARPADQGAHRLFGFILAWAGAQVAAACAGGNLTGHIAVFFEVVVSVHLQRFPIVIAVGPSARLASGGAC